MPKKVKKVDMNPTSGIAKDINLYITNEKTLYSKTHTHSFFEFMIVTKGKLKQLVNGDEHILSENDVCVLRPEATHTVLSHNKHSFIFYNFEVSISYINELCKTLGFSSVDEIFGQPVSYTRCHTAEMMEFMKIITTPTILTNLIHSEVKETSLKIIITKLLLRFLITPSHGLSHNKEDPLITTVLAMLEAPENFHLTIKEICESTFYTQEHITRLFKKANISSPNRIHLQKKLHYAANLLLNSDLNIIDIAEQCGIETVSYFTKTFKREYGISPSTYKKTYKRAQGR